ncbi:MAG TPA: rhomboid family intramembrane serine protease, partial [Gammaproteobacteria bacterium]|nr:rhomboid family intramembrane serine protease [Gammaproteobacteria bacterium]
SGVGHQLNIYGIHPRSSAGLGGILLWPFLHANFSHLIANTIPLAILGWFVLLRGFRQFIFITLGITLIAGSAVWLLARPAIHIGASGLVFGYFGFLVAVAWYEKSLASFVVAVFTLFLYGGLVWGVLPQAPNISWEAHLFGLMAGVVIASSRKKMAS